MKDVLFSLKQILYSPKFAFPTETPPSLRFLFVLEKDKYGDHRPTFPRQRDPMDPEYKDKMAELVGLHTEKDGYSVLKKKQLGHDEEVLRKLKGYLGKLSPDTMNSMVAKIRDLDVNSLSLVMAVVNEVFETALSNKFFQDLYAALCQTLSQGHDWAFAFVTAAQRPVDGVPSGLWYPELNSPDAPEQSKGYETEEAALVAGRKYASFRRNLLNRCEAEFKEFDQAMKADAAATAAGLSKEAAEEQDARRFSQKRRCLSLFSFIGELFNIEGMLNANIMRYCLNTLLEGSEGGTIDEEKLEVLCQLMQKIGKRLEAESRRSGEMDKFHDYLKRLQAFSDPGSGCCPRLKFACLDVLDSHKAGWPVEHPNKYLSASDFEEQERQRQARLPGGRGRDSRPPTAAPSHYGATAGRGSGRGAAAAAPRPLRPPSVGSMVNKSAPSPKVSSSPRSPTKGGRRDDGPSSVRSPGLKSGSYSSVAGPGRAAGAPVVITMSTSSGKSALAAKDADDFGEEVDDGELDEDDEVEAAAAAAPLKPVGKCLTGSALVTRLRSILSDYVESRGNLTEFGEDIESINGSPNLPQAVASSALTYASKPEVVEPMVTLITAISTDGAVAVEGFPLPTAALSAAVESVFAQLDDLAMDSPKLPSYLGKVLARLAVAGVVSIPSISEAAVKYPGPASKTLAAIINTLLHLDAKEVLASASALPLIPTILPGCLPAVISELNSSLPTAPAASLFPQLLSADSFRQKVQSAVVSEGQDELLDVHVTALAAATATPAQRSAYVRLAVCELLAALEFEANVDLTQFKALLPPWHRVLYRIIKDLQSPEEGAFVWAGVAAFIVHSGKEGWDEAGLAAAISEFFVVSEAVSEEQLAAWKK